MMDAFGKLRSYCESQHFKGWDPYDGLNSKVFQAIPCLKKSALCRLVVIQGFKRCPVNLRPIALVPKEYNAKGIGLFLQAYCNLYKAVKDNPDLEALLGTPESLLGQVRELADLLLTLQSKEYSGACWGYNFDWQARRIFLFPKNTPTVVATNFCATALMDAYEVTQEQRYLDVALSSARFVLEDLHRTDYKDGFLFSYSPLPGNDTVFNASLLGSKLLAYCFHYTGDEAYKEAARSSVLACCQAQAADGDNAFSTHIEKGFDFYIKNFFEPDGCPKYYHDRKFPIDIHCPGQLFVTLHRLGKFEEYKDLAGKVLEWTVSHMQNRKGYFYYQLKQGISSKIPYMRWSNAFMFNALSYYLLSSCRIKE